jgi:polar amino acid transport system substrate-binding protein
MLRRSFFAWTVGGAALVATAVLAPGLGSIAQARSLDDIVASKKMRLGIILVDQMVMRDPNSGELSGVWIDGIRRLFSTLNLEPEFIETKWATFAGGLQADQFDVFISGFMTPQRALALEYTRPVLFLGHSASTLKENTDRFKTLEDLNSPDVTIATVLGGSGHQFAKQFLPNATIKPLDTGDLTASGMEVLSGRATIAMDNAFSVGRFVKMHEDRMVDLFKDNPFNVLPVAWAINPGNPRLLSFLNTMLDYMETNGIWQAVAADYEDTGQYLLDRSYKPLKPQ